MGDMQSDVEATRQNFAAAHDAFEQSTTVEQFLKSARLMSASAVAHAAARMDERLGEQPPE